MGAGMGVGVRMGAGMGVGTRMGAGMGVGVGMDMDTHIPSTDMSWI